MSSNITVLNSQRTEFDFSNININTHYNIVLHCVYDPFGDFENEFAFLHDKSYGQNTLIILWHPVEQGHFDTIWMAKLDAIVESAPFKLVYLTGCSHELNVNDVFPHKFDLRFFPIFDIRSNDIWTADAKQQTLNLNKTKKFMFINSKDTPHRRYVLGRLLSDNLTSDGVVTYQCREGLFKDTVDFTTARGFSTEFLNHVQEMFDKCLPHLPIKIDDLPNANGLPVQLFTDSYINIVGETHFSNIPWGHRQSFVTEKTFNAISNYQMFIVVGHARSLNLLQSLGFKTFSAVIDESYDDIQDNELRLKVVTQEILRFINRPIEQIQQDYVKVLDIVEHNKNLLASRNSLELRLQNLIDTL